MTGQNAVATIEQPGSTAVAPRQAITPMEMLQIAVEKGATVEQLERLMALQERWEANEARKAFTSALSAFKANPPAVKKNKRAGFESRRTGDKTEYEYATLDNVVAAVTPALSEHGLSHRWETEQIEGGLIRVTCVLTHVMGHSERVTLQASPDQSGSKNNIQAIGSTVSYLQRYTLLAACGLAAADMDDDGQGSGQVEYVTEEQAAKLQALCEEVGADKVRFCRYYAVESFSQIPAALYQQAVAALERKRGSK